MWILYMTWDDEERGLDQPVNTTYVCEDKADGKEQMARFMSPHWKDWCFAQLCFHPELA